MSLNVEKRTIEAPTGVCGQTWPHASGRFIDVSMAVVVHPVPIHGVFSANMKWNKSRDANSPVTVHLLRSMRRVVVMLGWDLSAVLPAPSGTSIVSLVSLLSSPSSSPGGDVCVRLLIRFLIRIRLQPLQR